MKKNHLETAAGIITSPVFVKCAIIVSAAGVLSGFALLLPQIHLLIIKFGEYFIVHRSLTASAWFPRFVRWDIFVIAVSAVFIAFVVSQNSGKLKRIQEALCAALLLLICVYVGVYNYYFGTYWVNSDGAGDLFMSKVISEDSFFFSRNWYYGTEFLIINKTFPAVFIFKFINNFPLVRSITFFFLFLFTALSYIFMMRQTDVKLKYILISCCFLLIPMSDVFCWYMTLSNPYEIVFIKIFLAMGIYLKLSKKETKGGIKKICLVLFCVLMFITGLEGIRILYNFLLPLLITVILADYFTSEKKNYPVKPVFAGIICNAAAYIINRRTLNKFFVYTDWFSSDFEPIGDRLFLKLSQILSNFFDFFGYCITTKASQFELTLRYEQVPVLGIKGILSALSLAVIFLVFIASILITKESFNIQPKKYFHEIITNEKQYCLLSYFIVNSVFIIIFFIFVADNKFRHMLPAFIFAAPFIAFLINHFETKIKTIYFSAALTALFTFLFAHGSIIYYQRSSDLENYNKTRWNYIRYLKENNLRVGAASFWNANITTELSGGQAEVFGMFTLPSSELQYWKYHTKRYDDADYANGRAFLLLEEAEWEIRKNREKYADVTPAFDDGNYVILIYPNLRAIWNSQPL